MDRTATRKEMGRWRRRLRRRRNMEWLHKSASGRAEAASLRWSWARAGTAAGRSGPLCILAEEPGRDAGGGLRDDDDDARLLARRRRGTWARLDRVDDDPPLGATTPPTPARKGCWRSTRRGSSMAGATGRWCNTGRDSELKEPRSHERRHSHRAGRWMGMVAGIHDRRTIGGGEQNRVLLRYMLLCILGTSACTRSCRGKGKVGATPQRRPHPSSTSLSPGFYQAAVGPTPPRRCG